MSSASDNEVSGCSGDPQLEDRLQTCLQTYLEGNRAARVMANGLRVIGVGLRPLVDHIAFWTRDAERLACSFLESGYTLDPEEILEYDGISLRVLRCAGFPPLVLEQETGGENGLMSGWMDAFGDGALHHIGVRVDTIEEAVFFLEKQGIPFTGRTAGDRGSLLRQTFSLPEIVDGKSFTALQLVERRRGYTGFIPAQTGELMGSLQSAS